MEMTSYYTTDFWIYGWNFENHSLEKLTISLADKSNENIYKSCFTAREPSYRFCVYSHIRQLSNPSGSSPTTVEQSRRWSRAPRTHLHARPLTHASYL